jgi:hypothetical protein
MEFLQTPKMATTSFGLSIREFSNHVVDARAGFDLNVCSGVVWCYEPKIGSTVVW